MLKTEKADMNISESPFGRGNLKVGINQLRSHSIDETDSIDDYRIFVRWKKHIQTMASVIGRALLFTLLWKSGFGKERINGGSEITIKDAPYIVRVRVHVNSTDGKSNELSRRRLGYNPQNTDNLLRAEIYTISMEECNTGADEGRDRTYQICTRGENNAGPCQGDSGGP
ncbi:hypothetical protein Bhyg_10182, partial [Pseudolycoriella hygida]